MYPKAFECDIRAAVPIVFDNDIDKNNCLFELIMICSRSIPGSLLSLISRGGQPWAPPPRGKAQRDVSRTAWLANAYFFLLFLVSLFCGISAR
jgi:hypothetical protein